MYLNSGGKQACYSVPYGNSFNETSEDFRAHNTPFKNRTSLRVSKKTARNRHTKH